jgi:hypothetical protein
MAAPVTFWQRLVQAFRPDAATDGDQTLIDNSPATPLRGGELAPSAGRPLKPAAPRDVATRMVELVDAMQDHFHRQDARALELAGALDRLGGTLEQLAQTQRSQGDYLKAIAGHSETAARNACAATDVLGRIPDSLLAQAEATRTVARQVELARESDRQFIESLQHFGQAVDTLGSAGTAQVEALQRMSTAQISQHDALVAMAREQNRRFLTIVIVLGTLVITGLTAAIVLLALRASA